MVRKKINFVTINKSKAKKDFEKDFYKVLYNAFHGKTMKNVRNRLKVEIFKKDDNQKKYQTTIKIDIYWFS